MGISKSDLTNYVDRKIADKKLALEASITQGTDLVLNPILSTIKYNMVEHYADKLAESLSSVDLSGLKNLKDSVTSLNSYCNQYGVSLTHKVRSELKTIATKYIKATTDNVSTGFPDVDDAITNLREVCRPLYRSIKDLDTLKKELHVAIKNESSGQRAYKALASLGVDVSDFVVDKPTLPAIVNLSVDVNILNQ